MSMSKAPKRPVVEVVSSRYQPSKAELEEDLRLPPGVTPEDAARALLRPVDVRHISRPRNS